MSEALHFWQGGRRIEVLRDGSSLTIHAPDEATARQAADRVGIQLDSLTRAAPGLMRAQVSDNKLDSSMHRLRSDSNVVHHVYRDAQAPEVEYLITDSFFIKFKSDTPLQRIREYFRGENLVVEKDLADRTYLVRVTDSTGRNPIRTANAAYGRDDVVYAEPNLVRELVRFSPFVPVDQLFTKQWHLHAPANEAPDLVSGAGVFAADAWQITRGRRDVVVAVADDGFDLTHPDFAGEGKVVAQLNAVVKGNSVGWDENVHPREGNYHGTPCLGVAVAEDNGTGTVGVAPNCALVAVRFPLSLSEAGIEEMFRKISLLADVVSCSWGVGPGCFPMSTRLHDAITELSERGGRRGKGLIFCIAAGNNNCPVKDLENTRSYRFRQGPKVHTYTGPIDRWIAAHPAVITVSASTSLKTRAAYSSWGKDIWVCAPADNWDDLGETQPPGRGIVTTDNEGGGLNTDFTPGSRFTSAFGGTSSATPTVAGVCALVVSANPSLTATQVKDILKHTADKDTLLPVSHTPVNEPGEFDDDGHSLWFGYGKVNALKAVTTAIQSVMAERVVTQDATPNLLIPDVGSPATSTIQISDSGIINELRVSVDISHTFIGDLRVDLISPAGHSVVLHANTGGSARDLVQTYSARLTPALRPLIGSNISGVWTLHVSDAFRFDVGRLNSWRIAARLAQPSVVAARAREHPRRVA